MIKFKKFLPPTEGKAITIKDGILIVPDSPIIPFIIEYGICPDMMKASRILYYNLR